MKPAAFATPTEFRERCLGRTVRLDCTDHKPVTGQVIHDPNFSDCASVQVCDGLKCHIPLGHVVLATIILAQ